MINHCPNKKRRKLRMSPTMMIMIYDLIIIILLLIILQNFDIFFFNVKNMYFEDLMKN